MNWKEQIVLGLLGGPFLIWRACVNYLSVPAGAPWGAHLDLILAPAGLAILWGGFEAFRKRNDPQFLKRVWGRSRDQAFGWLVFTGLGTVGLFWRQPFWARPLTYGLLVQFGLIIFFARQATLCYRAPASGVKGTNFSLEVLLAFIGMPLLAAMGAYLFPPIELLQSQWTEMRVFGFVGAFLRSLAEATAGVLFLSAALFLGSRLVWVAIRNSRRQP